MKNENYIFRADQRKNDERFYKEKKIRLISTKRKRKLEKRGECVRWSTYFQSYFWLRFALEQRKG